MSTNKTENLGLHSWVETDPVLMREFNENFGAIDTAFGGEVKIISGIYMGDGEKTKTLFFPAAPKLLIIRQTKTPSIGRTLFMMPQCNKVNAQKYNGSPEATVEITWGDNSVTWYNTSNSDDTPVYLHNTADYEFHYVCFGI